MVPLCVAPSGRRTAISGVRVWFLPQCNKVIPVGGELTIRAVLSSVTLR